MFAGLDSLILRARYRTAEDEPYDPDVQHVTAAVLHRVDDRAFRGVFRPSADAVYAAFAVEDPAQGLIDTNRGAFWELLAYTEGQPSYEALRQKQHDLTGRSWRELYHTTRLKVALYPENPLAWTDKQAVEQGSLVPVLTDSIRSEYLRQLRLLDLRWESEGATLQDGDVLAGMYLLAGSVEGRNSPLARKWRTRLLQNAPRHPTAIQEAIRHVRTTEDLPRRLADFETLWTEIGPNGNLASVAFLTALAGDQPSVLLRWAVRLAMSRPVEGVAIAERLVEIPELRPRAIEMLRAQLQRVEQQLAPNRPLHQTSASHRQSVNKRRYEILAVMGRSLLLVGEVEVAMATLDLALAEGWNPTVFQTVADGRLMAGDTIEAFRALAMVGADPVTTSTIRDSLQEVAARTIGVDLWDEYLQQAGIRLYEHVWRGATTVSVPNDVGLVTEDGSIQQWRNLISTSAAVMTTWSPWSRTWLEQIELLTDRLRSTEGDFRIIAIMTETPAARDVRSVGGAVAEIPVYGDVTGRLREALNSWVEPAFHVLDSTGRVRFLDSSVDDVIRQVSALAAEAVTLATR
jgi:hypothetical protein